MEHFTAPGLEAFEDRWHFSHVVAAREHLEAFVAAKDRWIAPPYPAWSAIGVSELITEGALVEIRAIAAKPAT